MAADDPLWRRRMGATEMRKRRRFLLGVTYLVIYITCKSELGTFIFQLAEIALVSYLTKH